MVFPHQLFRSAPILKPDRPVYLLEDPSFFFGPNGDMKFHKKKLLLHLASMTAYRKLLARQGHEVDYTGYAEFLGEEKRRKFCEKLKTQGIRTVWAADPVEGHLLKRLKDLAKFAGADLKICDTPAFLTTRSWIVEFFSNQVHYSQTRFYIAQRKRLNLLVENGKPVGGKWSYDPQNRKRLPKGIALPEPLMFDADKFDTEKYALEARRYVEENFPDHPGSSEGFSYPVTHEGAGDWLDDFLKRKLESFGSYQDAISKESSILFHSQLSPLLNIGLLTPDQVLKATMSYAAKNEVPLNSLEAFIRQIIGWREYVRAVYILAGERERGSNFWKHHRRLPASFYYGMTGIPPLDRSIERLIDTGYLNHIERLMVLGDFMLLSEIDPKQVYRWFMQMFIDAYDWVMVPNVFGMSQYADGGLITTKPYLSSSNYILKMSDYPKGDWCRIWDALYWRFLHKHRDRLSENPRTKLAVSQLHRMDEKVLQEHLKVAKRFLGSL